MLYEKNGISAEKMDFSFKDEAFLNESWAEVPESIYDEFVTFWDEDMEDLEDEYLNLKEEEGIFSESNYNLDSPLLPIKLKAKFAHLVGEVTYLSDLEKRNLNKITNYLSQQGKLNEMVKLEKYHSTIIDIIRQERSIIEAEDLLKLTDLTSEFTNVIPKSFFKHLKKSPNEAIYKPRVNLHYRTKAYLELYLLTHTIMCLINNSKTKTLDRFKDLPYFPYLSFLDDESPSKSFLIKTNYDEILISETSVYWVNHNILFEKEEILLIKDIVNSRFRTLSVLQIRNDKKFKPNFYLDLIKLYENGDNLIKQIGNKGYDIIAMIEPFCNMLFAERSMTYKPLFPKFTKFREYVMNEILVYSQEYGGIVLDLFDMIDSFEDVDELATVFGSFRHWGHPFIEYKSGLNELKERVQAKRSVDEEFTKQVASSFALRFIKKYKTDKMSWCFTLDGVLDNPEHKRMKDRMKRGSWPTPNDLKKFGHQWHLVNFKKVLEVPDVIDPSLIYSDKSHSMTRSELTQWLSNNYANNPNIPTKRVLKTFLEQPATNWPAFLKKISEEGLPEEQLIIGLKAKERELKRKGRYFALMSWELRQYFVITEYLIKEHFISLYDGLTMADDQVTLMKKIFSASKYQGQNEYNQLTITNGIDYSKWCNTQSLQATYLVFDVMDRLLGYPNLISRTHKFFQKCWVYFLTAGADMMYYPYQNTIVNTSDYAAFWDGQEGGLEGLRQKGWSLISLIVLSIIAESCNSSIKFLAQGDNQIVCNEFKILDWSAEIDLKSRLKAIYLSNESLMDRITDSIEKLGLKINKSETMQSTDFLNYGKILVYRGIVRNLETKRYSRMSCTTNDQLPNFGNTLSTISSNCLTVSHQGFSCVDPICQYNWSGNLTAHMIFKFNPSLRTSCFEFLDINVLNEFILIYLYLDPSLGGLGGMSLTRFIMRGFPDPINEALAFWKIIYNNCDNPDIKAIACKLGNPKLKTFTGEDLSKLIESPNSLNIISTAATENMIKNKIRKELCRDMHKINNEVFRDALAIQDIKNPEFIGFLLSIKPLFPKFLSELYSASFAGIVDSMVGLIQNAKSIKQAFNNRFSKEIQSDMKKMELKSLREIQLGIYRKKDFVMWNCSYQQAKNLRLLSWGQELIGADIPHPIEFCGNMELSGINCKTCNDATDYTSDYILCTGFEGIVDYKERRGKLTVYMGSDTRESTSLNQSYEKETNIPLIKRAVKLLNVIGWFVKEDSNLSKKIQSLILSLTGELPNSKIKGIERTGCAVHRYNASRQSSGGFLANNSSISSRIYTTTDNISKLQDDNYTFMFQSIILYCKFVSGEAQLDNPNHFSHHYHVSCKECIDPVKDVNLDCETDFEFPDMHNELNKWKPEGTNWFKDILISKPSEVSEEEFNRLDKSRVIGENIGFFFSEAILSDLNKSMRDDLFPMTFRDKVNPETFCVGMMAGIKLSTYLHALSIHSVYRKTVLAVAARSLFNKVINNLNTSKSFEELLKSTSFINFITGLRYSTSVKYPNDGKEYVKNITSHLLSIHHDSISITKIKGYGILLGDFLNQKSIDIYRLAIGADVLLPKDQLLTSGIHYQNVNCIQLYATQIREGTADLDKKTGYNNVLIWKQEMKKIVSNMPKNIYVKENFHIRLIKQKGKIHKAPILFNTAIIDKLQVEDLKYKLTNLFNPAISSLRYNSLGTGSFYKLNDIITSMNIKSKGYMVLGDGAGGFSSFLLLYFLGIKMIFNTLIGEDDMQCVGGKMKAPTSIEKLPESVKKNCVNLNIIGSEPTDITKAQTWAHFRGLIAYHNLTIDLIVIDMETKNHSNYDLLFNQIEMNLLPDCRYIIKFFPVDYLINPSEPLNRLLSRFENPIIVEPNFKSSNSDEFYLCLFNQSKTLRIVSQPNFYDTLRQFNRYFQQGNRLNPDFERYYNIKHSIQQYHFYPKEILPDYKTQLKTILRSFHPFTDYNLDLLDNYSLDHPTKVCLLIIRVMLYLIPSHRSQVEKEFPSAQVMIKYLGLKYILNLIISLVSKDFNRYERALEALNSCHYTYLRHIRINNKYQTLLLDFLDYKDNWILTNIISSRSISPQLNQLMKCIQGSGDLKHSPNILPVLESHLELPMGVIEYHLYKKLVKIPFLI